MNLHDTFHDAVSDVHADLPELVRASRRQGVALRRRRRVLATAGVAASVVAIVGATYALAGGAGPDRTTERTPGFASQGTVEPSATVAPAPTTDATGPVTGRAVAAALWAAVDAVADGEFSAFRGQDPHDRDPDTLADNDVFAELLFAPTTGGPAGAVQVNLQHLSILDECSKDGKECHAPEYDCSQAFLLECSVRTLPDGDVLRTYVDRSSGSGDYERRVAEVLSARRELRIVVSASNTGVTEKDVVRAEPVLAIAQLTEIATQPWWGLHSLPGEYIQAGQQLPSYQDLDAAANLP